MKGGGSGFRTTGIALRFSMGLLWKLLSTLRGCRRYASDRNAMHQSWPAATPSLQESWKARFGNTAFGIVQHTRGSPSGAHENGTVHEQQCKCAHELPLRAQNLCSERAHVVGDSFYFRY
jgi:hypothetical protein